jgi:hypothetical protein
MKLQARAIRFLGAGILLMMVILSPMGAAAAQDQPARVQRITARLQAGEIHAYLLKDLRPADRLTVSMRATSGDLDPMTGITDTTMPLEEAVARYRADLQRLLAGNESMAAGLEALRNKYFLAWDDDSGDGYAAALAYVVPTAGDYVLFAGGSLSALGRATSGDYQLLIGLNAPQALDPSAEPTGAPVAERVPLASGLAASVEETSGTLTAAAPAVNLQLVDIDAGETLTAYAEATSGNLIPTIILRDFGGKALEAGNQSGKDSHAALQHTVAEGAVGYSLEVRAAKLPDGTSTEGNYRLLVGVNAPDVMTGRAQPQGDKILEAPIEVKTGLKILRISAVNSPDENFTVLGSLRMDWKDPALAFSPDSCNCSVKLYSEKEFDRFLADVRSRWPAFTFFNQLGNRWIQSRTAAIWPDGSARYAESFNSTFQADFNFRKYPFDIETFPIYLDLLYPTSTYTLTVLPGYSEIDPAHGEDEFIISDFTATPSTETPSAADSPVSRMTFSFDAPRHLNYYILQIFLPITLIILISWFTFFLKDYTRRIEAAAGNILLFIAFSFSLASDVPRLGYVTFLSAIMAVTFAVNALVLLYNVYMKRLESQGKSERVERIDNVLDWVYPLIYVGLIGVVAVLFL